MTPPHRVPMPPRTTIITASPDVVQYTPCRDAKPWPMANMPPASPDRAADRTNASSLKRSTL
ncbi:hypothetical protein BJF79_18760 [Actinomadura sp. CNU-125]|nr:hypothetical protein BJF79_18760 [Actinomadura sp. CNU-125]